MLCSNCFKNFGLQEIVKEIGEKNKCICPNCRSAVGVKLSNEVVEEVLEFFFRYGTRSPLYLTPLFRLTNSDNPRDHTKLDYPLTEDVSHDLKLIETAFGVSVFTPHINMGLAWGDTTLKWAIHSQLNKNDKLKSNLNKGLRKVIDPLIDCCKTKTIKANSKIFRIRKNPSNPHDNQEYDTPSREIVEKYQIRGRLDNGKFPLFYCSTNVSTCIYESKFEATDTLILATYVTKRKLSVIDLENINPDYIKTLDPELSEIFRESDIDSFLHSIFRSNIDYVFSQLISNRIYERNYDGVKYVSFYNRFRKKSFSNIALFGFPLQENTLDLKSLNRVQITDLSHKWVYGPALGR